MRCGYGGSVVINVGKKKDNSKFCSLNADADRSRYIVENIGGDARKEIFYIEECLKYLYYSDSVKRMDSWDSFENFKKMMSEYTEYTVKKVIPEFNQFGCSDIPFASFIFGQYENT